MNKKLTNKEAAEWLIPLKNLCLDEYGISQIGEAMDAAIDALKVKDGNNQERIAFICDRKKCKNCNPDCLHTTDINHAANFERILEHDTWLESKPTVDAISIEWINEWCLSQNLIYIRLAVEKLLEDWRKE